MFSSTPRSIRLFSPINGKVGRIRPCSRLESIWVEFRAAPINKHGSYQNGIVWTGRGSKDESRFADKWAYFNFSETAKTARPRTRPSKNDCWKCHEQECSGRAFLRGSSIRTLLKNCARPRETIKPGVDWTSESGSRVLWSKFCEVRQRL